MTILQVIFPIFAMALVGYVAVYKGILDARDAEGISRFVFNITLPALLFNSLARVELPAQFNWEFLFSYYVVALIVYGLGVMASRYWFAHSFQEQGVFGLGASFSNTVLVGLPVISVGLGDVALLPLFMIVSIHSAVLLFVFMIWMERGNGRGHSRRQIVYQTVKKLVRNPIIVSLALGLVFNLLAIPIPPSVDNILGILSKATLPCALFVMGASLNTYKITGHFAEALTMVSLKMVLQPFLVWLLAFVVFRIDPLWGAVAVMVAGMPVGITAFVFAQEYQAGIAILSTSIFLSTLLAVFSQSLLLAIFI
jgi:malonate transporter